MRYQKVLWHHDLPDEPVVLYAEISSGREVRDPQFSATAIPVSEFEHIWQHATQP
jgi:hypothetical protein